MKLRLSITAALAMAIVIAGSAGCTNETEGERALRQLKSLATNAEAKCRQVWTGYVSRHPGTEVLFATNKMVFECALEKSESPDFAYVGEITDRSGATSLIRAVVVWRYAYENGRWIFKGKSDGGGREQAAADYIADLRVFLEPPSASDPLEVVYSQLATMELQVLCEAH